MSNKSMAKMKVNVGEPKCTFLQDIVDWMEDYMDDNHALTVTNEMGASYIIYGVPEDENDEDSATWFAAVAPDGAVVGLGVNYYWVKKMADAYIANELKQRARRDLSEHGMLPEDVDDNDDEAVANTVATIVLDESDDTCFVTANTTPKKKTIN